MMHGSYNFRMAHNVVFVLVSDLVRLIKTYLKLNVNKVWQHKPLPDTFLV